MADLLGYLKHLPIVEILGVVAAILSVTAFAMKTMAPLRIAGIVSSALFIAYGILRPDYILLVLHGVLLPLNMFRLQQMQALLKETKSSTEGDLDMNWIRPFTTTRDIAPGEVVFRRGEEAREIIFLMSGSLKIPEIGVIIPPGELVGELGMLSPDKRRTQSVVCVDGGQILVITYDQVRELFFQNPKVGYYFMQLASTRLFENLKRAQAEIAALKAAQGMAGAPPPPVSEP